MSEDDSILFPVLGGGVDSLLGGEYELERKKHLKLELDSRKRTLESNAQRNPRQEF